MGTEYQRQYTHWVYLRLSDIYLTYAEALLQAKNDHRGAIDQMNIVRARVGLKKDLAECVTDKNLLSDKAALLEELLCERVRELGLEDSRYFDLFRCLTLPTRILNQSISFVNFRLREWRKDNV